MTPDERRQVDGYVAMVSEHNNKPLVPIEDQIAAAERELKFRLRVYPRWIEQGKMSRETSTHELMCMRAIVGTLQQVARGERLI